MEKNKGTIIYLHGYSSTGKTSMCRELEARKKYAYYVLGFDLFEETIPEWSYTEARYSDAIIAMYHAARCLSDQGQDVIIDGLIMQMEGLEHHYDTLQEIFRGYPLKIINVHCPFDILRKRNLARGDRRANQSEVQSAKVLDDIAFDCCIDSGSHSIAECVDLLLAAVDFREF